MSNLAGETSIADDDELYPPPVGQSTRSVSAELEAIEHDDRFLPVPVFPMSVRMADDSDENWRFDPATGTIYGRDVTTAGESYAVDAREPRPSPALLRGAEALPLEDDIQSRLTVLPPLDPTVTDLVIQLTADATGPYERVLAILDYLTDRGNGFIYSLATAPGTTGDDLVDFLRLKRGYCEQYAGAMAVHGPRGRRPGAGGAGLHPRHRAGRRQPGDHQRRRPRLGRGVLRRARLGALRPDAARCRPLARPAVVTAGGWRDRDGRRPRHRGADHRAAAEHDPRGPGRRAGAHARRAVGTTPVRGARWRSSPESCCWPSHCWRCRPVPVSGNAGAASPTAGRAPCGTS